MEYRKPKFSDVEGVYELVMDYANEGQMLARSRNVLYETLREMIIAVEDGKVIGVGALHILWAELAEVRSVAVAREKRRLGIGKEIVEKLMEEGRAFGVKKFFTLTYQPKFFSSLDFTIITKNELPHKVWKECIDCPKFPDCDEIPMLHDESKGDKNTEILWE
ncbi:MAG: N-acetyltransferase [Selenomonadaceae bacterium]|nr:N-acetyltransferase [Selenomonadaceae bacterium]MBP3723115.1 N-acetyltransferase [Selenomonadaceae bacterium]